MSEELQHATVLLHEAVEALQIKPQGIYVDGTFGRGGHSRLILQKLDEISTMRHGRIMFFMPPGSAKSTYASVVFPSNYLGKNAGKKIILASYGEI